MKILVAGIGNVFFGDDGFGCAVARALALLSLPAGVTLRDFGIRGLDLAYELTNGYELAILIDAAPRGRSPGELFVLGLAPSANEPPVLEGHGLTPESVLATAKLLGGELPRLRLVGCEPAELGSAEEPLGELSPPVARAVPAAVELVLGLIREHDATLREKAGVSHA